MKIVVKVGTQAILSPQGVVLESALENIVTQIVTLQKQGNHIVLVSSGAVGTGRCVARDFLGREYGNSLAQQQVLASLGQHELIHNYSTLLKKHGVCAAQLLLTKQDFQSRQHYLNIARILRAILAQKNIIPIVNENDSVAVEELMFTDNDELAGLIAVQIGADKLIILTTVNGVYDGAPSDPASQVISVINPDDKWQKVSVVKSEHGRGGMVSKLTTARKMSQLGIMTHIAHVNENEVISRLIHNDPLGTTILPFKKKSNVKRWMALNDHKNLPRIYINSCLYELIQTDTQARSILPVGIIKFKGEFQKGDLIDIISPKDDKIGTGLAKYNHDKLSEYLGRNDKPAFIHYDHLYLVPNRLK